MRRVRGGAAHGHELFFGRMDVLRSALEEACHRHGVRLLVLFGSHVQAPLTPGPDSDVDLAVAFRRSSPCPPYLELYGDIAAASPMPGSTWSFLATPIRCSLGDHGRGVLLFGAIDDFLELRAFAYRDFVDSADLSQAGAGAIREEAEHHWRAAPCCALSSYAGSCS